ncbi:prolyl oligopeptidase family-domain-containing protein [Dichomitus squalens]|nr:prolyl oligopeptidase family-domain-containing protein [Dichomitus squalens]
MWVTPGFPVSVLGLAAQVPLQSHLNSTTSMTTPEAVFKDSPDVFSPIDLVQLPRPGTGTANEAGDLVFVPVSQYTLKDKKNSKAIHIAAVETSITPIVFPLASGGEAFWLDNRTLAHAVAEGSDKDKAINLYAISVQVKTLAGLSLPDSPQHIGKFPTDSATNFRFSAKAGILVFSDYVHKDGELKKVKENDEAWENRGDTAFVYDETFERHWDTWVGPKRPSLFSVQLSKGADGKWALGSDFVNLLKDTNHHAPVEPFGGTDDFDVSDSHVIYTAKDPQHPKAWHNKQNIYIVDIHGLATPRELTSGEHGATHSPVFNTAGDKAAWTQLDRDGHESDRAKLVIYDLKKDVQYTLTEHWDRSVGSIAFAHDDKTVFFTANDHARGKIFSLPVPETPSHSSSDPALSAEFRVLHEITSTGSASAIQPRSDGRLVFTRSSLTVFAQQGYVVVAINPTGSTGFGQAFTDAIAEDWGGKPFVDLQKGWKYVLDNYPEVDPDRAVAAGASYGGYAINWIQGHPEFGFNFKALVCHDGAFGAQYHGYSTDELFFFNYEWGGRPWEPRAQEVIKKFDPINFVDKWETPMLVIHGSKDYRLPETDGIGAFHALQQRGVPSRLVIFPDENHWVLNHQNSLKWHYEVFRWLGKYSSK